MKVEVLHAAAAARLARPAQERRRHRCAAAGLAAAEFGRERAEKAAAMHTENDGGDEMERERGRQTHG